LSGGDIRGLKASWGRGDNLFDFLCLWYGVLARQMWRSILEGERF